MKNNTVNHFIRELFIEKNNWFLVSYMDFIRLHAKYSCFFSKHVNDIINNIS